MLWASSVCWYGFHAAVNVLADLGIQPALIVLFAVNSLHKKFLRICGVLWRAVQILLNFV